MTPLWEGYTTETAFGLNNYPRGHVSFRLLQVFKLRDGLIARENVWIDYPAPQTQLAATQQPSS